MKKYTQLTCLNPYSVLGTSALFPAAVIHCIDSSCPGSKAFDELSLVEKLSARNVRGTNNPRGALC